MKINLWVIENKESNKVFENSITNEPFYFNSWEEAKHYLTCFGFLTFGDNLPLYAIEYGGVILEFNEFCKEVDLNKRNIEKLNQLAVYLNTHQKKYSLLHLEFMVEHLNKAIERQLKREAKGGSQIVNFFKFK